MERNLFREKVVTPIIIRYRLDSKSGEKYGEGREMQLMRKEAR